MTRPRTVLPRRRAASIVWVADAGLCFIREDLVGIVAAAAWLTIAERPVADRFEDKVGAPAEDEQMAFPGRDDDLEGAVVVAGDDGI